MEFESKYIGDGVYIRFDGHQFILSTQRSNGIHWIALDEGMVESIIEYKDKIENRKAAHQNV